MHAYLIVGGSRETRTEKLGEILAQRERFNLGAGGEDSLKIEDVRGAEEWVSRKRNRAAALVVDQADRLTLPAQHAFLKTLEEPGDNILIVLTAADGLSLLATIRSRCKIIRLPASAAESVAGDQFAKLNTGTVAERLIGLYPILREITGSIANLHRGAVKRPEALMFIEAGIATSSRPEVGAGTLEAAATAHRRLKNNLNPTLVLHQFVMDIGASN